MAEILDLALAPARVAAALAGRLVLGRPERYLKTPRFERGKGMTGAKWRENQGFDSSLGLVPTSAEEAERINHME